MWSMDRDEVTVLFEMSVAIAPGSHGHLFPSITEKVTSHLSMDKAENEKNTQITADVANCGRF